jgi:hypothetical protein
MSHSFIIQLGIEDAIPDRSAFSRARNKRFLDVDIWFHPSRKWPKAVSD